MNMEANLEKDALTSDVFLGLLLDRFEYLDKNSLRFIKDKKGEKYYAAIKSEILAFYGNQHFMTMTRKEFLDSLAFLKEKFLEMKGFYRNEILQKMLQSFVDIIEEKIISSYSFAEDKEKMHINVEGFEEMFVDVLNEESDFKLYIYCYFYNVFEKFKTDLDLDEGISVHNWSFINGFLVYLDEYLGKQFVSLKEKKISFSEFWFAFSEFVALQKEKIKDDCEEDFLLKLYLGSFFEHIEFEMSTFDKARMWQNYTLNLGKFVYGLDVYFLEFLTLIRLRMPEDTIENLFVSEAERLVSFLKSSYADIDFNEIAEVLNDEFRGGYEFFTADLLEAYVIAKDLGKERRRDILVGQEKTSYLNLDEKKYLLLLFDTLDCEKNLENLREYVEEVYLKFLEHFEYEKEVLDISVIEDFLVSLFVFSDFQKGGGDVFDQKNRSSVLDFSLLKDESGFLRNMKFLLAPLKDRQNFLDGLKAKVESVLSEMNDLYEESDEINKKLRNFLKQEEFFRFKDLKLDELRYLFERKEQYLADLEEQSVDCVKNLGELRTEEEIFSSLSGLSTVNEEILGLKKDLLNFKAYFDLRLRKEYLDSVLPDFEQINCSFIELENQLSFYIKELKENKALDDFENLFISKFEEILGNLKYLRS